MVSGHPANAWTARAESLGAIAKELNDAGIPTLRGMVNGPQSRCSVCWGGCEPALDRKRGAASF